jgi:hypothetical protein
LDCADHLLSTEIFDGWDIANVGADAVKVNEERWQTLTLDEKTNFASTANCANGPRSTGYRAMGIKVVGNSTKRVLAIFRYSSGLEIVGN